MPELMDREDVLYLRDMLCLDATDKQAEKRFKAEIKNSLDGTWRRIDNWIHNAKQSVHAANAVACEFGACDQTKAIDAKRADSRCLLLCVTRVLSMQWITVRHAPWPRLTRNSARSTPLLRQHLHTYCSNLARVFQHRTCFHFRFQTFISTFMPSSSWHAQAHSPIEFAAAFALAHHARLVERPSSISILGSSVDPGGPMGDGTARLQLITSRLFS